MLLFVGLDREAFSVSQRIPFFDDPRRFPAVGEMLRLDSSLENEVADMMIGNYEFPKHFDLTMRSLR